MEEIKWLEVSLETTPQELDSLTARLIMNGAEGLVIEDEETFLRFLEEQRAYWDYVDDGLLEQMKGVCRVKFYVPDSPDGQAQLARWTRDTTTPVSTAALADNDWATSWQAYYRPMEIGQRLYIIPQWERENTPVPTGRTALYLNPGLTFGTGAHASTQLCLEGVETLVKPGDLVLDLGCGSGILSIAALRLGAAQAVALDIDPKAVDVAYENAAMNGIDSSVYTVLSGDILSGGALADRLARQNYQVVLANIVADVIIPLSAQVHRFLAEDGVFLCSGIIDQRASEVEEALARNGLTLLHRWEKQNWVALAAKQQRACLSEPN